MNRQLIILVIVICLGGPKFMYGQSQQFTGRLIDNVSKSPIKGASVEKHGFIVKSNHLGFFQTDATAGDTLMISHEEYEYAIIIVPNELKFTAGLTRRMTKADIVYSQDEVDQMPEPVIGMAGFFKRWTDSVVKAGYPSEARRNGIEGRIYIYFIIDELGEVIESGIERGIGYGCDEVALDSFNKLNIEWTSGVKNDEKVKVRMKIPFVFKLG